MVNPKKLLSRQGHRYVLEGDPIPLARCRLTRGPKSHVFDAQATLKRCVAITLKNQHENRPMYKGPLRVDFFFYFYIPRTRKDLKEGDYKKSRPDFDNLIKMVADIGQIAELWKDDASIVAGEFLKVYSHNPRTEFVVFELENIHAEKEKGRLSS